MKKNYMGFHIPKVWQILSIEGFAFMGKIASENRTVCSNNQKAKIVFKRPKKWWCFVCVLTVFFALIINFLNVVHYVKRSKTRQLMNQSSLWIWKFSSLKRRKLRCVMMTLKPVEK